MSTTDRPTLKAEAVPDEPLGQMLGRYKLLEKIGEGGFGVVYVAEQKKPVKRRIALKIIKLGMDTSGSNLLTLNWCDPNETPGQTQSYRIGQKRMRSAKDHSTLTRLRRKLFQDFQDMRLQRRKVLFHGFPNDLLVNAKIVVHQDVPLPGDLSPWHSRVTLAESGIDGTHRLTDDHQVCTIQT